MPLVDPTRPRTRDRRTAAVAARIVDVGVINELRPTITLPRLSGDNMESRRAFPTSGFFGRGFYGLES